MPPAVVDRHPGPTGRLHPVRAGDGQNPRAPHRTWPTAPVPDSVSADRAYSNGLIRAYLRRRGIRHVIPEKSDSQGARVRKGSRGGRPPNFQPERYKQRNSVERAANKLKQFRAVATRYDKRGDVYLGTVAAAALLIWLRS